MKYAVVLLRTNTAKGKVEQAWIPAAGATPYRVTAFAERRAEFGSEEAAIKARDTFNRNPEGGYAARLHPIE